MSLLEGGDGMQTWKWDLKGETCWQRSGHLTLASHFDNLVMAPTYQDRVPHACARAAHFYARPEGFFASSLFH